ncbi:hypothetical protein [Dyadobacter alkalitolerans]|uniref:hypothetical protein n=1 Tax=Dyadobacter alkalitolerans TaxID=492736 RepID=UPI000404B0BC|nr:hypothetical protein [Dyadobacter alkalitolerans]
MKKGLTPLLFLFVLQYAFGQDSIPVNRFNVSILRDLIVSRYRRTNIWGNAKVRWYYNMNSRMRKGLNANNFSGAYLAFSYDQQLHNPIQEALPSRLLTGLTALPVRI